MQCKCTVALYSLGLFNEAVIRKPEIESVSRKKTVMRVIWRSLWHRSPHVFPLQELKTKVLEQVQDHLRDILDKTLTEGLPPYGEKQQAANGTKKPPSR